MNFRCLWVIYAAAVLGAVTHPVSTFAGKAGTETKVRDARIECHNGIIVIGASYARSWNIDSLYGAKFVNKGVGGEQTHEMLARFDRDVLANRPCAVIVWGFINDIFRSNPEDLGAKLVRSRENIKLMVSQAKERGIVPVLATEVTMPVPDSWFQKVREWFGRIRGKTGYQDYINHHVIDVNRWIREYARANDIAVLDFEVVLADGNGRRKPEYATTDGTHLSSAAYEALTRYAAAQSPHIRFGP